MDKLRSLVASKEAKIKKLAVGRSWVKRSELEELERPTAAVRSLHIRHAAGAQQPPRSLSV